MNETMFHLISHMCYLKSIVELIKVYSSIEHQSAEADPRKLENSNKDQI